MINGITLPNDSNKSFKIPLSNPLTTFNAANPGTPITGLTGNTPGTVAPVLNEVYVTGLRNVFRASFDRNNGDIYMGDVGEGGREEVSSLKAGTNTGRPVDYGWPHREGINASTISGSTGALTNPFTGRRP